MNKSEQVNTNSHDSNKSKGMDWYQIVQLGEKLLHEDDRLLQLDLVKKYSASLFGLHVQVWIFESETEPDVGENPLAKEALDQNQPVIDDSPPRIALPLSINSTNYGVILFEGTNPFTDQELMLANGFADQCAIALQANRQIAKEKRQLELLGLVRSVSKKISEVLNLEELYTLVTSLIQKTFEYYYVAIFTVKPGGKEFVCMSTASPDKLKTGEPFCLEVAPGEGIIGYAAQSGELVVENDISKSRLYRKVDALEDTLAEIAVPLIYKNQVLGVLDIQSNHRHVFHEADLLALQALADNIAAAIETARLYSEKVQRAKHLASIADVNQAISSILDEDELLGQVVQLIHNRLGYEFVQLFSVHHGRRKIFFRAGVFRNQKLTLQDLVYDYDASVGIIPKAARNGSVYVTSNTGGDEYFIPSTMVPIKARSEMAVPLIFGDIVLGVLDIQSELQGAFSDDDSYVLETLADHIAVAMRNAHLYRSELWRRRVAESMQATAGLLTTNRDIQPFLSHTLQELDQILPIDVGAIWLYDEDYLHGETGPDSFTSLRLDAVYLSPGIRSYGADELSPDEIITFYNQAGVPSIWLIDALDATEPVVRGENDPYEPLGAILDFPPDYSALAAPLIVEGKSIGLLTLCHNTNGRYGHEAQSMSGAYANYVAIAVQNNRLYRAARNQAWVSTVLLQVAEATESLGSLSELLPTMARLVPSLVGIHSCFIYLWDESQASFSPAACFGMPQPQESAFWATSPQIGMSSAIDQAYFSKTVVVIDENNPAIKDQIFSAVLDPLSQSAAIFPMVTHGTVIGFILVDDFMSTQVEDFGDRLELEDQLSLLQGIAHQTATAVENILLLQVQQEETYISLALLQVAQAVSTLNKLEDVLSSIVRLMPILAGVRRCLIFLWDSVEGKFTLSQFFGLSKSEQALLEIQYPEGKFPVLDLCHSFNQPIFYGLHPDEDSPILWSTLDETEALIVPGDIGGGFARADQEFMAIVREYWKNPDRLLAAIPLAAKDAFLGVILTEESEIPSIQRVKVREKRHEIIMGVAQQAALAIQNDTLQHEVLARERLEREFQLARDIQKTFMPDQLPEPEGWQLAAIWQPALQVSGDFYDAFRLSPNRIGIVIADVADKGMPAALFMTLIRTLVRSTIQYEVDSPAKVLVRVNDLLLPDAKGGMFVTLAYCVVNCDDGQLIYANAGHNPPLLIRNSLGDIVELKRTGMALGVMATPDIAENKLQMEKGDLLLLYTDGITEAFSPEGEMFGELRLKDIVTKHRSAEPLQLAQHLMDEVADFIDPIPYSDDLTMIAIKRTIS